MIAQRVAVNQALKGFRGKLRRTDLAPYSQGLQARFRAAEASLGQLDAQREQIGETGQPVTVSSVLRYDNDVITELIDVNTQIPADSNDSALAGTISTFVALSRAIEVAERQLPGVVDRLQRERGAEPDPASETAPIGITSTDEIGQVARAFDSVHQVAVKIATDQALLRRDVADMFLNLARRSQSLVDRQLELIDDLEQSEPDPKALDDLFHLDHLATRMRRNAENLIVLSGAEPPRPGSSRSPSATSSAGPAPRSRATPGWSCSGSRAWGSAARRPATSSTCWPSCSRTRPRSRPRRRS
jgi:hypothetical protein